MDESKIDEDKSRYDMQHVVRQKIGGGIGKNRGDRRGGDKPDHAKQQEHHPNHPAIQRANFLPSTDDAERADADMENVVKGTDLENAQQQSAAGCEDQANNADSEVNNPEYERKGIYHGRSNPEPMISTLRDCAANPAGVPDH